MINIQNNPKFYRLIWGSGLALGVIIVDQVIKWLILNFVMSSSRAIEITPFLNLVITWNQGVGFGFLRAGTAFEVWGLIAIALIISVVLLWRLVNSQGMLIGVSIAMIIGGALGNVIDRLQYGAVVDFIDVYAFEYHWPAFNIADSAITLGVLFLVYEIFLGKNCE